MKAANRQGMRTIRQMIEEHHYAGGEGGLRRIIEDNKFNIGVCIRRVGTRIMVDLERYYSWLDQINDVCAG